MIIRYIRAIALPPSQDVPTLGSPMVWANRWTARAMQIARLLWPAPWGDDARRKRWW